jgi:ankyrin repeat protein
MHILAKVGVILLVWILLGQIAVLLETPLGGIFVLAYLAIVLYLGYYLWKKTKPAKKITDKTEIGKKGYTEMMWACEVGDEVLLRKLISAGNNVNKADINGATALMYAASYGNKNCVTALLENGAEVISTNKNGDTAQKYAEQGEHREIAKILKDWRSSMENSLR